VVDGDDAVGVRRARDLRGRRGRGGGGQPVEVLGVGAADRPADDATAVVLRLETQADGAGDAEAVVLDLEARSAPGFGNGGNEELVDGGLRANTARTLLARRTRTGAGVPVKGV
jgi:hypothetical protein